MYVIRHDNIPNNFMSFRFEVVKPLVYEVITACNIDQIYPFMASKSDEERSFLIRDCLLNWHF